MNSSYRSNRLGLSHWDPYTLHRGSCLALYYCNMVEWFWGDSCLIFDDQLVSFGAFDTVGLVIWPVKIVPEITYNVLSGMLSPTLVLLEPKNQVDLSDFVGFLFYHRQNMCIVSASYLWSQIHCRC